jgi:hypothetical protein
MLYAVSSSWVIRMRRGFMGWPRPYEYDPTSAARIVSQKLRRVFGDLTIIIIGYSASRHILSIVSVRRFGRVMEGSI